MLATVGSIGENIRRIRTDRGIRTQGELAKLLEVPQPQASDWENDRYKTLDTTTLLRIAKKLRVSVDELVVGVDNEYDGVRRDLIGQSDGGTSDLHGGSDVPASAQTRLRELESELQNREAFLDHVQDAATQLLDFVTAERERIGHKGAAPRTRAAGSGRGSRSSRR